MTPVSPTSALSSASPSREPASPEEAAQQFEAVLVRQFVEVMTQDLFDGEAEGLMTGQADLQRDTLTDTLTEHLVEAGTFGIADLMVTQWQRTGEAAPDAPAPDALAGETPPGETSSREALLRDTSPFRALGAQGRPPFIDTSPDSAP